MEVNADLNPLLPTVYLPVLTSLQRRAEPLWNLYGTVALRGCRLGLLHPRGAAPLLPDIPHSAPTVEPPLMKTHTRGLAALLRPLFGAALHGAVSLLSCLHTFTSSTAMIRNCARASCWAPFLLW